MWRKSCNTLYMLGFWDYILSNPDKYNTLWILSPKWWKIATVRIPHLPIASQGFRGVGVLWEFLIQQCLPDRKQQCECTFFRARVSLNKDANLNPKTLNPIL